MHLLLLCLLTLAGSSLFAQLQKGDRLFIPIANNTLYVTPIASPIGSELGTFTTILGEDNARLTLAPSLGFMLNDKWMLGGSASLTSTFGNNNFQLTTLGVFARNYFLNTDRLAVFGQIGANLDILSGALGSETSSSANVGAGVSLPLADNVLFTPGLQFAFGEQANALFLDFAIELKLGRNNRPTGPATGKYGRGSLMVGTYVGDVLFSSNFTEFQLSPQALYFLTDRLALGINPVLRFEFFSGGSNSFFHAGATARYFIIKGQHIDLFVHAGFAATRLFSDRIGPFTQADGGLGAMLFLRHNIALEAGVTVRPFLGGYEDLNLDPAPVLGLTTGVQFFLWGQ